MTPWQVAYIRFDGDDFKIGDLSAWKEKRRRIDFPVVLLPHPAYSNQMHKYEV